MTAVLRRTMTRADFLTWAELQEGRYEFDGMQPVAMTGGSNNHGMITRNLHGHLFNLLRGTPCQAMPSEGGGIATIGNTVRFPDATVTCSPIDGRDRFVPNPVIVFEVLSDGSNHTDMTVKKIEYQAVPSVRRYVLIEQSRIALTVHARAGDGPWSTESRLGRGMMLDLPEIGVAIPVDDLYERVASPG